MPSLSLFPNMYKSMYKIPLMQSPVSAWFPSPALDYIEKTIDISEFLISHPNSTFILRVSWDSMKDKKLFNGDYVVVDKSIPVSVGQIVIAELWWEFLCKEFKQDAFWKPYLKAHNTAYDDIYPQAWEELSVWWVVVWKFNKI